MQKRLLIGSVGIALAFMVIGSFAVKAQSVVTGTWKADLKSETANKLQLSFERKTENGGRNQNSSTYDLADLEGLDRASLNNGKVSFRLVREAGTIDCEGSFSAGLGSGTFRFTPNQTYVEAMRNRGFDFAKTELRRPQSVNDRLFTAALLNLTTAFTDELRSADFGPLDVDDLFKAVIFKITPQFIAEMKATGFPNLTLDDLVKARIFKIDAAFVSSISNTGFATGDFESLVKFRIFKVTPEFLNEIRNEGLTNITAGELVKLRIFKIDAADIRAARTSEPEITVEQLVRRRIGRPEIVVGSAGGAAFGRLTTEWGVRTGATSALMRSSSRGRVAAPR